jgi:hypothetical protein
MLGRPAVLLVVVAVLAVALSPAAGAFSTTREDLYLAFDAANPPALLATGAIDLEGTIAGGLVVAGSSATRLQSIPHLTVVDRAASAGARESQVRDATLEIHEGGLLWSFPEGASMTLALRAPYALGLGLPQAPIPSPSGDAGAGFLLAGESVTGTASWAGGVADLVPFDAVVTIRDARGTPLPGWESRQVNQGARSQSDPDALPVVFRADGAFDARLGATLLGGATGSPGDLRLHVSAASEDRLAQTAAALEETTSSFFGSENPFSGVRQPLDILAQVSGILNGALLVASTAPG